MKPNVFRIVVGMIFLLSLVGVVKADPVKILNPGETFSLEAGATSISTDSGERHSTVEFKCQSSLRHPPVCELREGIPGEYSHAIWIKNALVVESHHGFSTRDEGTLDRVQDLRARGQCDAVQPEPSWSMNDNVHLLTLYPGQRKELSMTTWFFGDSTIDVRHRIQCKSVNKLTDNVRCQLIHQESGETVLKIGGTTAETWWDPDDSQNSFKEARRWARLALQYSWCDSLVIANRITNEFNIEEGLVNK